MALPRASTLRAYVAEWPRNQFFNMAYEEAFFREAREPTLRFWRNDRVVVIGRLQSPALEVNAAEALRLGVKLVRRFTGGGAVYHDLGNINYALALPGASMDVEEAFRLVGEAVAEALRGMGAEAYYRPLNDVEIGGLKVSGLAASRSAEGVFVHGALLVSSDIEVLWKVLRITQEKLSDKRAIARSRVKRVITLSEALGRRVEPREVYEALATSLSRRLGLEIKWDSPSEPELRRALKLYRDRYSRPEWNLLYTDMVAGSLSREELEALGMIARPDPEQEREVPGVGP
ncbi:MAG: biotin/lipoate A/B protein ligase family protein [Desulfurococcaceae archaeon]